MDADVLDSEIKTRIPRSQKKELEAIARGRQLKVSDIVREALRAHILRVRLRRQMKERK
jgi:hypothetical protein